MARSRKLNLKSILKVVVFAALAILLIGGISSCFGDDTDKVSMFEFERGELDKNGEHVESKRAVYTKTAFECQGLECSPDFDGHISYDVYYYDVNGNFIDSVTGITGNYTYDHPFATHARVVIHPDISDDESEDDYEIPFYKVYTIANKLDISVSVKQNSKYNKSGNLVDSTKYTSATFVSENIGDTLDFVTPSLQKVTGKIAAKYSKYDIYVKHSGITPPEYTVTILVANADNTIIAKDSEDLTNAEASQWVKMTIEVPDDYVGASYLLARVHADSECFIFGY